MIAIDDPFEGRSILDLEALRVRVEDELDDVQASAPGSPSIPALQDYLGRLATGIARLA
jgi:hypothetical protein